MMRRGAPRRPISTVPKSPACQGCCKSCRDGATYIRAAITIPAAPATKTLAALRAELPLLLSEVGLVVGALLVEEAPVLVARLELLELLVMVPLALLLVTASREKEELAEGVAMVVVLKAVAVETRCMVMVLVMVMVEVAVLVSAAAEQARSATLRTEDSCIFAVVLLVRRR
jgi:hypothetical protein